MALFWVLIVAAVLALRRFAKLPLSESILFAPVLGLAGIFFIEIVSKAVGIELIGSCGSEKPGACFGASLFLFGLSWIATPIGILLLIRRQKRAEHEKK